jgi:hypothetical protein
MHCDADDEKLPAELAPAGCWAIRFPALQMHAINATTLPRVEARQNMSGSLQIRVPNGKQIQRPTPNA